MTVLENVSLAKYTTFKIGGNTRFFCIVSTEDEIVEAIRFAKEKQVSFFVLGGGSNLLVSDEGYSGLVIRIELKGSEISGTTVKTAAGESWDDLVAASLTHGLNGLENLSSIPGTVGASVVQNIGAYGTEVADYVESVRVFDAEAAQFKDFSKEDCAFAYRDSIFKHNKNYLVTEVTYKLKDDGLVNIGYKDLTDFFGKSGNDKPTPAEVREAVVNIRSAKLPDWRVWGTAGSYFKNPVISQEKFDELKVQYPDLPGFPEGYSVKVSLGWILDKVCGLKGYCLGKVCLYEKQALVIVAQSGATASEVRDLEAFVKKTILDKTGIQIEAEVERVG